MILLRLYPRAWRERYEAEMMALLEEHDVTLATRLDLLRGAFDAWQDRRRSVMAPIPTDARRAVALGAIPSAVIVATFLLGQSLRSMFLVNYLGLGALPAAVIVCLWARDAGGQECQDLARPPRRRASRRRFSRSRGRSSRLGGDHRPPAGAGGLRALGLPDPAAPCLGRLDDSGRKDGGQPVERHHASDGAGGDARHRRAGCRHRGHRGGSECNPATARRPPRSASDRLVRGDKTAR